MKRRLSLIRMCLVILISIFIPFLSAYLDYSGLVDFDFPARDRSFENPDQVDLFVAQQNEPKLLTSGFYPVAYPPGIDLLEQFSKFHFLQTLSSDQETTILRC